MSDTQKQENFNQKIRQAAAFIDQGRPDQAERILLPLVDEAPRNKDPLHLLGEIYMRTSEHFQQAVAVFTKILELDPDDSFAWRNLGIMHYATVADYNKATTFLTKAYELNPEDGHTLSYLGHVSFKIGLAPDAIDLLHKAMRYLPDDPATLSTLGMAYLLERRHEEAQKYGFRALELMPESRFIYENAKNMSEFLSLGEKERQLLKRSEEILKKDPQHAPLIKLHEATALNDNGNIQDAIAMLKEIVDNGDTVDPNIVKHACYNLAKYCDKIGEFDLAFSYAEKGNRFMIDEYTKSGFPKNILYKIMGIYRDTLKGEGALQIVGTVKTHNTQPSPRKTAFLMGFPRSGTTLSARILGRHPQIFSADEMGGIHQALIHCHQEKGLTLPQDIYKMRQEDFSYVRRKYDEFQDYEASENDHRIFLDKNPLNSAYAASLYAVFPETKFLFIHRHPLDSLISGFMQYFRINSGMVHFCDIEDIARLHMAIYEDWKLTKDRLPIDYHEFYYEDLVADFDGEIGKILQFLDLEWDEAVHDFYKKQKEDKVILTPSKDQISKKLYTGSQNRWKHYEKHLGPAIEILEPMIKELGYSLD